MSDLTNHEAASSTGCRASGISSPTVLGHPVFGRLASAASGQGAKGSVISGMHFVKRILLLATIGAALGFLTWSILGQGGVSLMFGSLGGTFTCKADVEHALQQFVRWQLYCALAGAVVVPCLTWLIRRAIGKKGKPAQSQG